MKAIFLILAASAALSISSCKKADEVAATPTPETDTLGAGWSKVIVTGASFSDIFFNGPLTGYAVGDKIYKSTDGGNTWAVFAAQGEFYNAFLTPDSKAFFVKGVGGLFRSTPAVPALVEVIIPGLRVGSRDVFFTDNNTGFYIGDSRLYTTTNGGLTWVAGAAQVQLVGTYASLYFANSTTGWIINGSTIYKTDGTARSNGLALTGNPVLTGIHAVSGSVLYVAGSAGKIFKSIDGGSSFTPKTSLTGAVGWTDIFFLDELNGYASVDGRIFKTSDGAVTWTRVVKLASSALSEIHFTDAGHGWACGGQGTVLVFKQ